MVFVEKSRLCTELPEILPFALRKVREYAVFGVVERALTVQRPVPAPRSFKAQQTQGRQLILAASLFPLIGYAYTVLAECALHFFQVGLAVIAEKAAYIFGSFSQYHSQNSLSALEVCRLMDVSNLHIITSEIF